MRVILKWENRFGKYRRIMKPKKAQRWAQEFESRGFKKVVIIEMDNDKRWQMCEQYLMIP